MNIFIISGLSGSGKTVALHALEDEGFYCMDNLPIGLLTRVVQHLENNPHHTNESIALGVDARSRGEDLKHFPQVVQAIREAGHTTTVLFLQTEQQVLLKRFSETRRKHPLSHDGLPLLESLEEEKQLLAPILVSADITLDTTGLNIHELNLALKKRLGYSDPESPNSLSVLVQSFGFKHGIPLDSDYVFDMRCLPNPYWESSLRKFTGLEEPVIDYLSQFEDVHKMIKSMTDYLDTWIPVFANSNRSYLTVSIGCTGGRHRSVYVTERVGEHLQETIKKSISIQHRDVKNT
ncbi:MAG: RNase adapter RapZ [bacterium]